MFLSVTCLMLLVAGGEADYPRKDMLVEASELARPEVASRYRILDSRTRQKYQAGHIPGAAWVDHAAWSQAFAAGQEQEAWSRRVGTLGVDAETSVIVYDDSASREAARIWWILRYWGIKDVRLLNGGWPAWQARKGQVATEESAYPARVTSLRAQVDRLATKRQLLDSLKNKSLQIVDARSEREYCGTENTARRNGAIPGALHLEWIELLDKQSQRFKDANELSRLFQDKGIDLRHPTVTHCQSGGRAAVLDFGLELMGADNVRNYYKSWAEWGNADDTPIEKPKEGK
jgi:thiosulfate/3-mercaptopyruvate sulfurtransferase